MSLNTNEINQIINEIDIKEAFIQKIKQLNFKHIIFQIFKPSNPINLFISLEANKERFHKNSIKRSTEVKHQRFAQFLRSHIQGSRITEFYQISYERIVVMKTKKGDSTYNVYFRIWNNASNIIVTNQDHIIQDCFYRRPKRKEVTGEIYNPFSLLEKEIKINSKKDYPLRFDSDNYNQAIEKYYDDLEHTELKEKLKEKLHNTLEKKEKSLAKQILNQQKRLNKYENIDQYKEYGDLLSAYTYLIKKGMDEITLSSFHNPDITYTIKLNQQISAGDNIQYYYKQYKKSKTGFDLVKEEINNLTKQEKTIIELQKTIENIDDIPYLEELLSLYEMKQNKKKTDEKTSVGLQFYQDGFLFLVGRNSKENDTLLRSYVKGNDYWLHTRDYPGGYVFIRYQKKKSIPLNVLIKAGHLAVHFSKAKGQQKVDLYYTQVKHLKRPKEGKLGLVLPTQEQNLLIDFDQKILKSILE